MIVEVKQKLIDQIHLHVDKIAVCLPKFDEMRTAFKAQRILTSKFYLSKLAECIV